MNFLEKLFFKDTLNNYRLQVLYHMRWFSLLLIVLLLSVFYLKTNNSKYGYAITQKIWPQHVNEKNLPYGIYYEAKGLLPIKSNKILNTLIFGAPEDRGNSLPLTNPDLIAAIILLVLAHFFSKAIIKYGPFHQQSIKWLKKGVIVSLLTFFFKGILLSLFESSFEKDYDETYSLDTYYYVGYSGWLYFSLLLSFFLNIFQYGKKIQQDNDLTI
jgi:glucose-6-phosphate-specific signal transduction histidine kinase